MQKLPVIKTMIGALYYPWTLRKPLFKALSILIVAGVVLSTAWQYAEESIPWYYGWFLMALSWGLYSLSAVICHRSVLLGSSSVPEYGVTQIGGRDFRYALALIKIGLVSIPVIAIGSVALQIPIWIINGITDSSVLDTEEYFEYLSWVTYLIQIYIFSRFGLILPATAVDDWPTLRWSWHATRGNTLRLMMVLGLFPWLVFLPSALLPYDDGIVGHAFYILIWWLFLPIEIAALSLSYKELVQEQEQEQLIV